MAGRRSATTLASVLCVATFVSPLHGQDEEPFGLRFFGDFRLRYEVTTRQEPGSDPDILEPRSREVVRFRGGVGKQINDLLFFGARLATGSRDNPNTADITLSDFVDGLEVSLDRAYLELSYRDLFLTGGKFPNPFLTATDLVWDDDVSPMGLVAGYSFSGLGSLTPSLTGVYSIVDEQTINPDSYMWGGQVVFTVETVRNWAFTVAGAYVDYTINSLSGADAGDTRSNNLSTDSTAYLSDFDLINAIAIVEYRPLGRRFPVRFVGNYVKNSDAAVAADQGFSLDAYVGKLAEKKDLRIRYGFSKAETDAVLAAFSHDNTTLATNYLQHTVTIDYFPLKDTLINLTWYYFRKDQLDPGLGAESNPFISRLRLNAQVRF